MRRLVDADELKESIEKITWYHINKLGELVEGANSSLNPLYRADDIYKAIDNAPTVDCIEVERAKELIEEGYQKGHIDGVLQGEKLYAGKCLDWIPTSEMLPERYDSYLVMWRRRDENADRIFYEIIEYEPSEDEEDGEWGEIEQAGEAGAEIVAWMPLPERYEPKEKENG